MTHESFYRNILDRITSGVYFVNRERFITYWNKGAEHLSGFSSEEVVGRACSQLLNHSDEDGRVLCGDSCPLMDTISDGAPREVEVLMLHKLGQRVPVLVQAIPLTNEKGEIAGAVEIFSDISPLKLAQARIHELTTEANLDPLTGIYNRRGLEYMLREWFLDYKRFSYPFGVIFIDVDDFKQVNDRFGHTVGDEVLIGVASRLRSSLRESDVVGRWGGDEFVILLRNVTSGSIERVVGKLANVISGQVYETEAGRLMMYCSLGGASPT